MGVEDVLDVGVNERHFWGLTPILAILLPLVTGTILIISGRFIKSLIRVLRSRDVPRSQFLKEMKTLYMQRPHLIKKHSKYSPYSVRTFFSSSTPGAWWNIFQIFLTIMSVTFYVVESYYSRSINFEKSGWMLTIEIVIAALFTLDYLIHFYGAEDRLKYFWSVGALVDLLTVIPVIIDLINNNSLGDDTLKILRAVRIFRLQKALQLTVSATILMVIESLPFHDALYLITVTFTTVGYGDLSPHTAEGRVIMIVLILISFFVLSYQTSLLISAISEKSPYDSGLPKPRAVSRKHVVIFGEFTVITIKEIFREFLHQSHRSHNRIVVYSPHEPPKEIQQILKVPFFQQNVTWLRRSSDVQNDMQRIRIADAAACFMSSDPFNDSSELGDTDLILQCIAVKSFAKDIPIYAQVLRSEVAMNLRYYPRLQTVPWGEIIMSMLGQNCLWPGFSVLIMNLIRTNSSPKPGSREAKQRPPWLNEYVLGASNGISKGKLPAFFFGKTYQEAATFLFARFQVTLVALEVSPSNSSDSTRTTKINPIGYVINPGDEGFMICPTEDTVASITSYKREKDEQLDTGRIDSAFFVPGIRKLVDFANLFDEEETVVEGELVTFEDMSTGTPTNRSMEGRRASRNSEGERDSRTSISSPPRPSISAEYALTHSQTEQKSSNDMRDMFHASSESATLESRSLDRVTFTNHIVIVGPIHEEYSHLILTLRRKNLPEMHKVVLVHHEADENEWMGPGYFPEVYFFLGDIEKDHSLLNLSKCQTLLILSDPSLRKVSTVYDAHTIILVRTLQNMYRGINIISEIAHPSSGRLLPGGEDVPSYKQKFKWYQGWNPTEMLADDDSALNLSSGSVVAPTLIFNALLAQSYYHPHLVHIVQLLVVGAKPGLDVSSNIRLMSLPDNLHDRSYGYLFHQLITECKMIPIALYRYRSRGKPFVFTNPPPSTYINSEDKIFVLAPNSAPNKPPILS
ncbi:cation channel family protein [Planoprotostelium fungivorum]|uniref:Cation channel family protein n=1 Tax=Planoprotostelium fungivorum TaxID=1890364 RepID=A0A2P6MZ64_9EUKA|nr:cation channel family protein [Planoprotostelium fungivorum]